MNDPLGSLGKINMVLPKYPQSKPKKVPVRRGGCPHGMFSAYKNGVLFIGYNNLCIDEAEHRFWKDGKIDEIRISKNYDLEKYPLPEWCELVHQCDFCGLEPHPEYDDLVDMGKGKRACFNCWKTKSELVEDKPRFNAGDRVKCVNRYSSCRYKIGTIKQILQYNNETEYSVEFASTSGHFIAEDLELVEEPKEPKPSCETCTAMFCKEIGTWVAVCVNQNYRFYKKKVVDKAK